MSKKKKAKLIVFLLSNIEPFPVDLFLIDKTQTSHPSECFFVLSVHKLFRSLRGKAEGLSFFFPPQPEEI